MDIALQDRPHITDMTLEQMLYQLDERTRQLLKESAPLMARWSRQECTAKAAGGMEEWAKDHKHHVDACDWYHGTWQFLRLLNMVAVPPWYGGYHRALGGVLRRRPRADVLISACADYGMLAMLHEVIETAGSNPRITIYDICRTPLLACEWYATRHGLEITCVCDNIITSTRMPLKAYDLIVTDEFLTVLKDEYKPLIVKRWQELLKPGGTVVTTAMIGGPTTAELREGYAIRARRLFPCHADQFGDIAAHDDLEDRFTRFAKLHTRHMLAHEGQIRALFSGFDLSFSRIVTPGECVNPTSSFEIVASLPDATSTPH
jgi:2-polyprenyl-3-methyl-5-hydroxy-6-metoxy-1,4-benzoquinol methylase